MALTINVPDTLRKSVEAASNGRNTVLYTAKGQPCYMYVLQKTDLAAAATALGMATHPAFVVNGVTKSELFIGQHIGSSANGEMLSVPGVRPINTITHDAAVSLVRANGAGWHLMTNVEWAAIGHWCYLNGFQPRGNSDYGRSDIATERGVDDVTGRLALATGTATTWTRTGSGPASWRHDNTPFGIADLNGNVWEWSTGMRLMSGEIQFLIYNDAAAWNGTTGADLSTASASWQAIDGATGLAVPTGSANAVRIAASGTAAYTLVVTSGTAFEGMTNPSATPVSAAALNTLRSFGLYPVGAAGLGGDGIYTTLTGEIVPIRGGSWNTGALGGVFALSLSGARSNSNTLIGARPAFVL